MSERMERKGSPMPFVFNWQFLQCFLLSQSQTLMLQFRHLNCATHSNLGESFKADSRHPLQSIGTTTNGFKPASICMAHGHFTNTETQQRLCGQLNHPNLHCYFMPYVFNEASCFVTLGSLLVPVWTQWGRAEIIWFFSSYMGLSTP